MAGTGRLLLLVLAVLLVGAGAVGGSLLPRAQLLPSSGAQQRGDQALPDRRRREASGGAQPGRPGLPFYETRFSSQLYVRSSFLQAAGGFPPFPVGLWNSPSRHLA
uniref:Uncharacterized protein n=1 Tax=Sphaerodactylus townsendi TaxID=933632 RepID=A0ACB8G6E6_9SAUR